MSRAVVGVQAWRRLGDDGGGHPVEVVVLEVEARELAIAAKHRPEGQPALGPSTVPSQLEGLQAAGPGLQREG